MQQQQQPTDARAFWDTLMAKYPNIHGVFCVIGSIFGFFFGGHIIVALGQRILLFCGRVAETVMLFAVVFLTANFVAEDFLSKHIGADNVATLVTLAILALSLLPEVTLYSAIIVTLLHWLDAFAERKNVWHWSWSIIYSVPTAAFFGMTVYTIAAMVGDGGHFQKATGLALVLRCLAAWLYGLIELIYVGLSKRQHRQGSNLLPSANNALPAKPQASNQQIKVLPSKVNQQISKALAANMRQFALLSQQTANDEEQISKEQTANQQVLANVQQNMALLQQTVQQISKEQSANVATLQQNSNFVAEALAAMQQTQANVAGLASAVNQVKEELAAPRQANQQSQQRLFALPGKPAKLAKSDLLSFAEDSKDTGVLLAVDPEIMRTVQALAALEALAGIEQSDIYSVVQAYQSGVGRSQIYRHLGWGSSKHGRIVCPVIDAYEQLSKEQQAVAN